MSDDKESDLFLQEMGDVKPIKAQKKIALTQARASSFSIQARREAATKSIGKDENHLVDDYVELLDPFYPLEFKRAGVQNGVFKKLKQGKYQQDARLDLHRMTVEIARKEVFNFIKECFSYDIRTVIIIPGKGSHNQSNQALLKSYLNRWLPDMNEVQAFCSAQPQHGGLGAVYVLLSKSEKKKQENRDRISRGRTRER